MSDDVITEDDDGRIIDTAFSAALSERYLAYALSTITLALASLDVRDGLKPVHRRLLFAMRQPEAGSGAGVQEVGPRCR